MRNLVFGMLLAAVLAAPALAQRGPGRGDGGRGEAGRGGFGGGTMLLAQPSVQDELKLSDEQKKQVAEHAAKQRESFSGLRDLSAEERAKRMSETREQNQQAVASILNDEQAKRFRQINLQVQGTQALASPEVASALELNDDQKKKIADIQQASREEMRSAFQPGGDRDAMRTKLREARQATDEKIKGVLTSEQQTKWQEMTGAPFEMEFRRQGPPSQGQRRTPGEGQRRRRPRDGAAQLPPVPSMLTADTEDTPAQAEPVQAGEEKKQRSARRPAQRSGRPSAHRARGGHGPQRHAHRARGTHPGHSRHAMHGRSHRAPSMSAARAAAWQRVARAMGHSGSRHAFGGYRGPSSRHPAFAQRGPAGRGHHTAWRGGSSRHGHHGHVARGSHRGGYPRYAHHRGHHHHRQMAARHFGPSRGPQFSQRHRGPGSQRYAHFGHRGHGSQRYAHFAPGGHYHGPRMAYRGYHHGPRMAHRGHGFGPSRAALAARPQHGRPAMHGHHHHGPGRMHLSSFQRKHKSGEARGEAKSREDGKSSDAGKSGEAKSKRGKDAAKAKAAGKKKAEAKAGKAKSAESKAEAKPEE